MAVGRVKKVAKVRDVKLVKEFRAFIMKGNVLDLAVGIIVGLAFSGVVNSMVNDVIMPPIGTALGGVDFRDAFVVLKPGSPYPGPYATLANATQNGAVTWRFGSFVNTVINFLIVAFAVFMMIRVVARMRAKDDAKQEAAPTERDCPRCLMKVPVQATRCGHCTSEIAVAAAG